MERMNTQSSLLRAIIQAWVETPVVLTGRIMELRTTLYTNLQASSTTPAL